MVSVEDFLYPLLKHYTISPQWVKSSVGRVYSLMPASLRFGGAYQRFANELRINDSRALLELRDQKLRATLEWALKTVPAYARWRHLLKQHDDPHSLLAELPLTGKVDIKAALDHYVSNMVPENARLATFTGGSTANPMKFYLHRGVTRSREFAYVQAFDRAAGIRGHEVILAMRGRSVAGAGQEGRRLWMYEPIKRHLIISTDHLDPRYMPKYVDALRQWKPEFIQAFPSAIFPLARWFADNPAPDVTSRIRCIQLTSENAYDYQLAVLRSVFRCPIIKHYGHSERVLFGATVADDERYVFWPLYGHLELVDADGRAIVEPGVLGEIVGTGFDNLVMPFVRYRTGDMGMLADRPVDGFDGWPVLAIIEGRLQEFVVSADRRLISIATLGAAHFEDLANVEAIQYMQDVPGVVVLRIQNPTPLADEVVRRLERAVAHKTQGGCRVIVKRVERIERTQRGKLKMLEQHIDLSGYMAAAAND